MDNNRGKNLQYQLACSAYIQLSLIQQPSLKSLDPNPPLFLQKERNHMTVTTKLQIKAHHWVNKPYQTEVR